MAATAHALGLLPGRLDLYFVAGTTVQFTVLIRDEAGNAIDLTPWKWKAGVAEDNVLMFEFYVDTNSASEGLLTMSAHSYHTLGLEWREMRWALHQLAGDYEQIALLGGQVQALPGSGLFAPLVPVPTP